MFQFKRLIAGMDFLMIVVALLILSFSYAFIYSADYSSITNSISEHYHDKQLRWIIIGGISFIVLSLIDFRRILSFTPLFYGLGIILLILVLFIGAKVNGARSWINVLGVTAQPSELFKFVLIITIGRLFLQYKGVPFNFIRLGVFFLPFGIPIMLTLLQPDLGTVLVYLSVVGVIVLLSGVERKVIISLFIIFLVASPFAWNILKPYQQQRILIFLHLVDNQEKTLNYQVFQSAIAIGSGGLTGKGYLQGQQTHLRFIPEAHTDLIFAIISEEFGFVGGFSLILLFMALVGRILYIGIVVRDVSAKMMCFGVVVLLSVQFAINIAMVIGLFPVIGIPIPLVSYGGSQVLVFMSLLGLVNSIYIRLLRQ